MQGCTWTWLTHGVQMQSKPSTRARVPGGLKEVNSACANARSGLMQPGTIAKQPLNSRMSTQPNCKGGFYQAD